VTEDSICLRSLSYWDRPLYIFINYALFISEILIYIRQLIC